MPSRGRIQRPDPDLARSKPLKSWIKPSIPWPGQGPTQASSGLSWASQGMAGVPQGLAWAPKSQAWASQGLTWPCWAWLEPLRVWLGPPRAWLGPPRTPIEPPKGLNWDYDGHWTDIWMDGWSEWNSSCILHIACTNLVGNCCQLRVFPGLASGKICISVAAFV